MNRPTRGILALLTSAAAIGATAGQAAAAPVTISTDAGTTCTLTAGASLGGGFPAKPVNFNGEVSCSLADPAKPVVVSANLLLRNSGLPLGIGEKSGMPDSADTSRVPQEEGFSYTCAVTADADCSHSGTQPLGLIGQTYTALFGAGFSPPEGERWVNAPAGCTLDAGTGGGIACSSTQAVTVR